MVWFLVVLIGVLIFAFGPAYRTSLAGIIRAFVAFYFATLGLGIVFGPRGPDDRLLLGTLFAALGLTYFWATRAKGVK